MVLASLDIPGNKNKNKKKMKKKKKAVCLRLSLWQFVKPRSSLSSQGRDEQIRCQYIRFGVHLHGFLEGSVSPYGDSRLTCNCA